MSKSLKIILIIVIFIILTGVIIWFIPKKDVGYVVIKDGYSDYESKIISNYQEYMESVNDINLKNFNSNKYNEEYFQNKSLAIINIITGNSTTKLKNIDLSIVGNILICKVDITPAASPIDDITGKLILVEIDKSVTNLKIKKEK